MCFFLVFLFLFWPRIIIGTIQILHQIWYPNLYLTIETNEWMIIYVFFFFWRGCQFMLKIKNMNDDTLH